MRKWRYAAVGFYVNVSKKIRFIARFFVPLHPTMEQQYPSQLLEKAVSEFAKLPGIGRKTALRLVLHLLRQPLEEVEEFATSVSRMRQEVRYCRVCHNISDEEVCPICGDRRRGGHQFDKITPIHCRSCYDHSKEMQNSG